MNTEDRSQQPPQSSSTIPLRVFLASPEDVLEERELAFSILKQLPDHPLLQNKIKIEIAAWDKHGAESPMLANLAPQKSIEKSQLKPSQCDIVIVIFWSRVGTSLSIYEYVKPDGSPYLSGTEWELCDALEAAKQRNKPDILIYRRTEEPSFRPKDPKFTEKYHQWQQVENLFATFQNPDGSIRVAWNPYETVEQFKEKLTAHLNGLIAQLLGVKPDILLPSKPKVYHNLPQRPYSAFIGRMSRIDKIRSILKPYPKSQYHLISIDGVGGVGKSSLALEVAYRYVDEYDALPPEERFQAIIWMSAKRIELTDQIRQRPPEQVVSTLDAIYTVIAAVLERKDISSALSKERSVLIAKALSQQRTLLIVDNLETVDDEGVNAFLRELPAPAKAIVTTRHRIDVAHPIRLKGMRYPDGMALIAQECKGKGVVLTQEETKEFKGQGVVLTEDGAARLYDRTGGIPLAIVWSVGQMGLGYNAETVLRRLGAARGDISGFCFEETVRKIRGSAKDKDAYRLVIALSLFAHDASRGALGYVTGLDEDIVSRDEGLAKLEILSLVNRQANRFSLLPLTRTYLLEEAKKRPRLIQDIFERMLEYYKKLVTPSEYVGVPYWEGLFVVDKDQNLDQEWDNLTGLIQWALDKDRKKAALDLFLPVVHVLEVWGSWDERVRLTEKMRLVAHDLEDQVEAWLWIDAVGYILHARRKFDECIEALNAGRVVAKQFNNEEALILADVFEADLYTAKRDINSAQKKFKDISDRMEIDEAIRSGSVLRRIIATRVADGLAYLSFVQNDQVDRKKWYEKALELRRLTGENVTPILCFLSIISLQLNGDIESAEKYLKEAVDKARKNDSAAILQCRGMLAEKRGEWKQAREYYKGAAQEFERFGDPYRAQECKELDSQLDSRLPPEASGSTA